MSAKNGWDAYKAPQAASDRGWYVTGGICRGYYLDYGDRHWRGDTCRQCGAHRYIHPADANKSCRDCEPGNILASRYPAGPSTPSEARYFETVAQAQEWVAS